MDITEFTRQAYSETQINALIQGAEDDARRAGGAFDEEDEPQRYVTVTGIDLLFSVAAYALFRYLKDYFDARRAISETATAAVQAEIVASLVQDGFPHDKAEKVVKSLLDGVAARTKDDPAITKALALLGKTP